MGFTQSCTLAQTLNRGAHEKEYILSEMSTFEFQLLLGLVAACAGYMVIKSVHTGCTTSREDCFYTDISLPYYR